MRPAADEGGPISVPSGGGPEEVAGRHEKVESTEKPEEIGSDDTNFAAKGAEEKVGDGALEHVDDGSPSRLPSGSDAGWFGSGVHVERKEEVFSSVEVGEKGMTELVVFDCEEGSNTSQSRYGSDVVLAIGARDGGLIFARRVFDFCQDILLQKRNVF